MLGIIALCALKFVTAFLNLPTKEHNYYSWYQDNDHYTWILNTLEAQEKGISTIHHIDWDGGPKGRDSHWAGGLLNTLRAGALIAQTSGLSFKQALLVSLPFSLATLYSLLVLLSYLLAARLLGPPIGAWLTLAMYSNIVFVFHLHPLGVDHPAILLFSLFLCLLGILGLFVSKLKTEAACISAIGTAIGIWTSAVNMIPVILPTMAGLFIAIIIGGPHIRQIKAIHWKIWGITGGITTLCFYFIEYRVGDPIWLESNNPLYALSMFAGGYTLAYARPINWRVVPTVLLAATPLFYKIHYGIKMAVETTYLRRHMELITEAQPMPPNHMWFFGAIGIAVFVVAYLETNGFKDWAITIPFALGGYVLAILGMVSQRILPYAIVTLIFLVFVSIYAVKSKIWREILFCLLIVSILQGLTTTALTTGNMEKLWPNKAKYFSNVAAAANVIKEDAYKNGRKIHLLTQIETAPTFAFYTGGVTYGGPYWETVKQMNLDSKLMLETDMDTAHKLLTDMDVTYIAVSQNMNLLSYPVLGEEAFNGNAKWFGSSIFYPVNTPKFLTPLPNSKGQLAPECGYMLYRVNY